MSENVPENASENEPADVPGDAPGSDTSVPRVVDPQGRVVTNDAAGTVPRSDDQEQDGQPTGETPEGAEQSEGAEGDSDSNEERDPAKEADELRKVAEDVSGDS